MSITALNTFLNIEGLPPSGGFGKRVRTGDEYWWNKCG